MDGYSTHSCLVAGCYDWGQNVFTTHTFSCCFWCLLKFLVVCQLSVVKTPLSVVCQLLVSCSAIDFIVAVLVPSPVVSLRWGLRTNVVWANPFNSDQPGLVC